MFSFLSSKRIRVLKLPSSAQIVYVRFETPNQIGSVSVFVLYHFKLPAPRYIPGLDCRQMLRTNAEGVNGLRAHKSGDQYFPYTIFSTFILSAPSLVVIGPSVSEGLRCLLSFIPEIIRMFSAPNIRKRRYIGYALYQIAMIESWEEQKHHLDNSAHQVDLEMIVYVPSRLNLTITDYLCQAVELAHFAQFSALDMCRRCPGRKLVNAFGNGPQDLI